MLNYFKIYYLFLKLSKLLFLIVTESKSESYLLFSDFELKNFEEFLFDRRIFTLNFLKISVRFICSFTSKEERSCKSILSTKLFNNNKYELIGSLIFYYLFNSKSISNN